MEFVNQDISDNNRLKHVCLFFEDLKKLYRSIKKKYLNKIRCCTNLHVAETNYIFFVKLLTPSYVVTVLPKPIRLAEHIIDHNICILIILCLSIQVALIYSFIHSFIASVFFCIGSNGLISN